MSNAEIVRSLLTAIESNDTDGLRDCYHPDLIQTEYPNQLVRDGATRNLAQLIEGARRGSALLAWQRYEIVALVEAGDEVILRALWSAELAIDLPTIGLTAGQTMRAHFAQFLTLRDGRIIKHDTYDCFEKW